MIRRPPSPPLFPYPPFFRSTLKDLLLPFTEHRHTVITRRTQFELQRAQDREHILEGLKIAVDHIDEVIRIIKKSKDTPAADAALRKRFKLSEKQSAEILNMRLARLDRKSTRLNSSHGYISY